MDGGAKALTIDEVPLEWCMGNGAVLDFRKLPDGYPVEPADIDNDFVNASVEPGSQASQLLGIGNENINIIAFSTVANSKRCATAKCQSPGGIFAEPSICTAFLNRLSHIGQ